MPLTGIAVCIATRNRPEGLRRLLGALVELAAPPLPVRVVVVDNGSECSVRPVVEGFAEHLTIELVEEPRLGIPFARNAALDRLADTEVMACIDDDCVPGTTWLVDLLDVMSSTGADAVGGPARYLRPDGCREWLYEVGFTSSPLPDGALVEYVATNNGMFRVASLRARALRFDERFPLLGGEDSWISNELFRAGGQLRWAANVVVDEYLPAERVTLRWLLRRRFANGYASSLRRLRHQRGRAWCTESARVVARVVGAALLFVSALVAGRRQLVRGLQRAALAAGSIWALGGGRFVDYRVTDGR